MKKILLCAVAVATTMSLTSCLSEEEVNLKKGDMGTITVNIEADNSLATRANVADVTSWFAFIDGAATDFGSSETHRSIAELAGFNFPYGSYDVTVSNYANIATAHAANSGFGAAYYEGTAANQTVTAGQNTDVTVSCGKAQNVKFDVQTTGFEGNETTGLLFENVTITSNSSEATRFYGGDLNVPALTTAASSYYVASTTLGYTVNWRFNGEAKNYNGTITLAGAGTQNNLSIVTNANGTITIANTTGITYDDGWTDGTTSTVTVSAETGEKLTVE